MKPWTFDPGRREASLATAFSGNRIVRDSENRKDNSAAAALENAEARILVMSEGRLLLKLDGGAFEARFSRVEARNFGALEEHAILLGNDGEGPVLAIPTNAATESLPEAIKAIDYRSIYRQGLLDRQTLGALAQGAALVAWNENHRFCGRCGTLTEMRAGGYKRFCPSCERESFPRTDPVVIMLAVRGDTCLLGRSPHFPPGMYSCLAGFVEPGETIEDAVRRETFEEAGIKIGQVAYHASQPWPFPYSLMIGCYGEAIDDTIDADRAELEDCRWVSRAELQSMIAGQHSDINVPPPGAIASVLLHDWAENAE
jgi:NAD+ diphosphatase